MLPALSQDLRCGADRANSADQPSSYLRPSAIVAPSANPRLVILEFLGDLLVPPARTFPDRSTGTSLPNNAIVW
jgi:hypothetical protein